VSPSYAAQIQGPAEGGPFAPLLAARGVVGVANGLDRAAWDPSRDPHLPQPFTAADLSGKGAARRAALAHFGVLDAPDELLLGVVARLVHQKGLDLLLDLLPVLHQVGARLLILGEGDAGLAAALRAGVEGSRRRAGLIVGFDEGLAHRIIAGADVLLVPSRFEPCGLTQLAAQATGTVPLVHPTGGLRDTVDDPGDEGLRAGRGSGLWMEAPTGAALVAAVQRAASLQRGEPAVWDALRRRIMGLPLGWEAPAQAYLTLYGALTGAPGPAAAV
jgi:starch synthase